MIKYNPRTWIDLIFHQYSRRVVKVLSPSLIFMAIYTSVVCYIILDYIDIPFTSTTAFHRLLGIVLGLILVFRLNSAYDRWWEGRKLWGSLVNNSRNLSFKINAMVPHDLDKDREYLKNLLINFVYAFKEHLRSGVDFKELTFSEGISEEEISEWQHQPNYLLSKLYIRINTLYKEGKITGEQFFILDKELKSFADIMGACERIKNTPIPYNYSMYIKKFIFTYTITLPFGFVTEFEYLTIPVVLLLFFILVSIELIAEEIEEPFGRDENDLPTDNLADKIKANIEEVFSRAVNS